jgi:hypothetical protein
MSYLVDYSKGTNGPNNVTGVGFGITDILGGLSTFLGGPGGALVGLGIRGLGGLLDDSAEQQLALRQAELAETKRQFDERNKLEQQQQANANTAATQNVGTTGLSALANQRIQASKLQTFRDALRKKEAGIQ